MTTTDTGASRSRGAPARSGTNGKVNGKVNEINFKGVHLTLPPKLPFRAMKYMAAGDEASGTDVVNLLTVVYGEDQMDLIWDIDVDISKKGGAGALGELLRELVEDTLSALRVDSGE